mgnify:FL=1|jgi:hypothetical protein
MKTGDLVKFVGAANFYKDRIGVVCSLYSTHGISKNGAEVPNSALVYFAGAERLGRAAHGNRGQGKSGLHPMSLIELEVIDRQQSVPIV